MLGEDSMWTGRPSSNSNSLVTPEMFFIMEQFRQEGRRRTIRLTENTTHAEAARELIQIWRGEFSKLKAQEKLKTVMLREMFNLGAKQSPEAASALAWVRSLKVRQEG